MTSGRVRQRFSGAFEAIRDADNARACQALPTSCGLDGNDTELATPSPDLT